MTSSATSPPASPETSPGLALVTGASSGIGRALALTLARHGYDLVVAAEDERLQGVADEIAALGVSVHPVQVDLATADLWAANFDGADMPGANLAGCDLRTSSFRGTHMPGVNLRGADLSGAQFDEATNLTGAQYDQTTTWPDGFTPPDPAAVAGDDLDPV